MEKDIQAADIELTEARAHAEKTQAKLAALQSTVESETAALKAIEAKIAEETKMLTAFAAELDALDLAMKAKRQEIADGEVKVGEVEHRIDGLKKDRKACKDAVAKMEKQYDWIADENQCVAGLTRVSVLV